MGFLTVCVCLCEREKSSSSSCGILRMNKPVVLFSSKGTNPLKHWDICGPKNLRADYNRQAEQLNRNVLEIHSADSTCTETLLQKSSPVKVQIGTETRRDPLAAYVEKVYDEELRCVCVCLPFSLSCLTQVFLLRDLGPKCLHTNSPTHWRRWCYLSRCLRRQPPAERLPQLFSTNRPHTTQVCKP